MTVRTIDVDQHLFESRRTWAEHIDPDCRTDALSIEDDAVGWPWLTWRGQQLAPIEIPRPEQGRALGDDRSRRLRGDPPLGSFDELVPATYGTPADRLALLDGFGLDGAVLFPNYGLLWEKMLAEDRPAQRANARAYNRFMADVCADGAGRLFGVAHLFLHDPQWAVEEIRRVAAQGVRLAMVSPAPVNGKPLSHADFDPVWRAFSEEGVAPVFHVSGFESPIHPAWHIGETDDGGLFLDSIFLWLAPAVAVANLILSGTLERYPDLRLGIVELTASWVPSFLLHIDGATDFFAERHGGPFLPLRDRPSEYFFRQVRVAALPYEMPARLVQSVGEDTFMVGSDWPHAEGVADPSGAADRAAAGLIDSARTKLLGDNAAWLLGLDGVTIDLEAKAEERARLREQYLAPAPQRAPSVGGGVHHVALLCADVERTITFYQGLLGFPLVELFENRDYQGSTHLFFDIGHGNTLAFFDFPGLDLGPYAEVIGGLHHLALSVSEDVWQAAQRKLEEAGVTYHVDSRISMYFSDPDGVRLELIAERLGSLYGTAFDEG